MINQLRNMLFPPPMAVVVIIALVAWFAPLTQRPDETLAMQPSASTETIIQPEVQMIALPIRPTDQEALAQVATRSLFLERRAPWKDVIEPEPVPEEQLIAPQEPEPKIVDERTPPPEIVLVGNLVSDGVVQALIKENSSQNERWILEGDTLGEWLVVEINNNGLVLRAKGEELVVSYNR